MTAQARTGWLKGSDATRADERDQPFDRALVTAAFTRLHPTHREVIHQAYFLQYTTGQIAADLNVTEAAVKCLLHQGLRALRRTLDNCAGG